MLVKFTKADGTETYRAEWIHCIVLEPGRTYCGRTFYGEWAFLDVEHARATMERKERLVPCVQCREAAGLPTGRKRKV